MRTAITKILLLFCLAICNITYGQRTINLTIDTSCFVSGARQSSINGTLGLYTNLGEHLDTLIQEVAIINKQEIVIEKAHERLSGFKLVFPPADTLLPKNQYIIDFYVNEAYLSCYFFNQPYSSYIEQLEDNDTLLITSEYIGNTGPLMPATSHFLKIWHSENVYYASFATIERYPNQMLIPDDFKDPFGDSILLTKKHLKFIRNFEEGIMSLVDNKHNLHHENSLTTIEVNNKIITFYSKGYMSLIMWNELKKLLPTKNKRHLNRRLFKTL